MSVLYPRARTLVLGLGQEGIEALLEAAGGVRVLVGAGEHPGASEEFTPGVALPFPG